MMNSLKQTLQDLTPKSWICFKEGYSLSLFWGDLLAGLSVGIISLPLTMAFAIASGLSPERGIFTAIVAGFLISLLGGSRVQIAGPTGAFVVIIYSVVERHGYEGLALATLIAGFLMIAMAICRAGVLLKFIPYSVTTGFTAGIALSIFSSQVKDLFGLDIAKVPADFTEKWAVYLTHFHTYNPWALIVGISALVSVFALRKFAPRLPGPILVVGITTFLVYFLQIPVETIETKFGDIPDMLPSPSLPFFSWDKMQAVFPDAITIAFLGAIESLLSAVVADGMTGHRHRSNTELFAQGIGNLGSILFGGIPATGALARTAANIKLGAKTPVAGMLHAVTLFVLIFFFANAASKIPLTVLGAILVFIAWNMSEMRHIAAILKGPKSDILVMATTFALTVLIDLTVAVQVGVLMAAVLFLKNMSDQNAVKVATLLVKEEEHPSYKDSDIIFRQDVPEEIAIYEIEGPLFFGVCYSLLETIQQLKPSPKIFILRMHKVTHIDASGIHALEELLANCEKGHIELVIAGVKEKQRALLSRAGFIKQVGAHKVFSNFQDALHWSKNALSSPITHSTCVRDTTA